MLPYIGLAIITVAEVVSVAVRAARIRFKYPVVSRITAIYGTVEGFVALYLAWPFNHPPTMFVSILIALAVFNLALSMRCKTLHQKHWGGRMTWTTDGNRTK
jgi:hypothetical protein